VGELGKKHGKDGREEESKPGFNVDLKERNHLEGLDVDGRILLNRS
jgi:hypothetical protein